MTKLQQHETLLPEVFVFVRVLLETALLEIFPRVLFLCHGRENTVGTHASSSRGTEKLFCSECENHPLGAPKTTALLHDNTEHDEYEFLFFFLLFRASELIRGRRLISERKPFRTRSVVFQFFR